MVVNDYFFSLVEGGFLSDLTIPAFVCNWCWSELVSNVLLNWWLPTEAVYTRAPRWHRPLAREWCGKAAVKVSPAS